MDMEVDPPGNQIQFRPEVPPTTSSTMESVNLPEFGESVRSTPNMAADLPRNSVLVLKDQPVEYFRSGILSILTLVNTPN